MTTESKSPRTDAILEWNVRCNEFSDMRVISHADINIKHQEEIDDLRLLAEMIERELTTAKSEIEQAYISLSFAGSRPNSLAEGIEALRAELTAKNKELTRRKNEQTRLGNSCLASAIRNSSDFRQADPDVGRTCDSKYLDSQQGEIMQVIEKLPMAEYLAMPAVSASLLKTIVSECPRMAWHQSWMNPKRPADDSTKTSDAGTIAHGILLEGSTANVEVIDPEDHPAEKTGAIPNGWTNKSIKAARDVAILAGKIPVLQNDFASIEAMVAEARRFLDEEVKAEEPAIWAAFQPGGGDSELTITWTDESTTPLEPDTPCRIRPDRISTDRKLIVDYKTTKTSAEPDRWGRTQMVGMGYYTSAAFYHRGIVAAFDVAPAYAFLVQEQDPPYLCSLVGVDPHGFELGTAKIAYGLQLWQACVKSGRWPGYPGRVCYPEIPAWEDARWQEREEAETIRGVMFTNKELSGGIPL